MAHTPEQRDKFPLCGARKKDGTKCRMWAGWGTTHPGVGRCKRHLGATANLTKAALVTQAKRQMATFGEPVDVTSVQVMLGNLRTAAGHTQWLHDRIAQLPEEEFAKSPLVRLYNEERDRLHRYAEACLDAGVEERMVQLTQDTARQVMEAASKAVDAAQLTGEQQTAFTSAFREALMAA